MNSFFATSSISTIGGVHGRAHGNLNPDGITALHLIWLASLLMRKIDERI